MVWSVGLFTVYDLILGLIRQMHQRRVGRRDLVVHMVKNKLNSFPCCLASISILGKYFWKNHQEKCHLKTER